MADRWDPLADPLEAHPAAAGDGWTVGDDTGPLPRCKPPWRPPWWLGMVALAVIAFAVAFLAAVVWAPPAGGRLPASVTVPDLTTRTPAPCRCAPTY